MGKRKQGVSDMFAVLEHTQRTAHFPDVLDIPACVRFYASIIERFDAAMMRADTGAALEAKDECSLYLDHVYAPHKATRGLCHNDVSRQLAKSYRASEGQVPKWGQEGSFVITVASVPVQIEIECLCGLGMFGDNLMPHFSIHIVEKHRLFLSHTGYRSFFPRMGDTEPGLTVADAVGRVLRQHVQQEMKGKLEKYDPYKGYSPKHRRDLMIANGASVDVVEAEAEHTEDTNLVEDDDLVCDGCDASLSMVDEFMEHECGTFCARCYLSHSRACNACELDLIDAHGGTHPSPTRSGGALLPAQEMLTAYALSGNEVVSATKELAVYEEESLSTPQLSLF